MSADVVIVGRIGGAYGVHGWVRVSSYTDPPENLLCYTPWLLASGGQWKPIELVAVKPHGQGYVAQIAGVDTREQAQALSGRELSVPDDTLPVLDDDNEFYWRDLVGLEVINSDGCKIGIVGHLLETGVHDVLAISPTDGESEGESQVLIPFAARFIRSVDVAAGRIEVDWEEPL